MVLSCETSSFDLQKIYIFFFLQCKCRFFLSLSNVQYSSSSQVWIWKSRDLSRQHKKSALALITQCLGLGLGHKNVRLGLSLGLWSLTRPQSTSNALNGIITSTTNRQVVQLLKYIQNLLFFNSLKWTASFFDSNRIWASKGLHSLSSRPNVK